MADKRVIEEPSSTELYSDDWFLKDSATNGTTKILASKLRELLCGDYIADEWVAGETYTNGAIVSHEGKLYYNKSGGTLVHTTFNSNSWLEVRIDELLEKLIGSIGEKWRSIDTYRQDDLVVYGGRLYRCIKNASTQGTWVSNEWIETNAEYYFKKVREYIARYGFVPSREAVSSPYNKGDLILYRAPGDTTNSLYMRLNDTEHGDSTWIPENWLKVENIGGALSKIYDDIEESSCDIQIKEQSIVDENNVADLTSLAAVGSASGAIATFDDGSDLPMSKLEVGIDPIQDLHGYDNPWAGGAGKNKLPLTVESIKTASDKSTWNNNSITINGVTYEIQVDTDGNVSGIKTNGTASGDSNLRIYDGGAEFHGKLLNGCPSNGSINTYYIQSSNVSVGSNYDLGNGTVINQTDTGRWILIINIKNGTTVSNLVFKPMIRLASEQDATFAPYSNICPISGWDECNVTRCGENLFDKAAITENKIINNTTGEETVSYGRFTSDYIKVNPSTDYYASNVIKSAQWYCVFYYDKNKNYLSCGELSSTGDTASGVVTTPSGCNYARLVGVTTYKDDVSFVVGNQPPTTYEPYNGHTYTIDLDGIRYGGELDVVSGVLTVDRIKWTLTPTVSQIAVVNISDCIITIPTDKTPVDWNVNVNKCMCNKLKVSNYSAQHDNHVHFPNSSIIALFLADEVGTTKQDWVDYLAQAQIEVSYIIATPQTIQLTPTQVNSLLGVNNIWADTGNVLDAEYIRDMTTVINSLIARIEALENQ